MTARSALALSTALAVGVLAAPAAIADDATDTGRIVAGGEATWGIKESFMNYLTGKFAGGQVKVDEGASFNDSTKEFTFSVDAEDSTVAADGTGEIALDGAIDLKAHNGLGPAGGWGLDVVYDDFTVIVDGVDAQLTADYRVAGADPADQTQAMLLEADDAVLATFTLATPIDPAQDSFELVDASTFAGAGVEESLINYGAGSQLAPIDLALSFADVPVIEGPAEDKPADEDKPSESNPGDKPAGDKPALSSGGLFGGILNALKSFFAALGLKF